MTLFLYLMPLKRTRRSELCLQFRLFIGHLMLRIWVHPTRLWLTSLLCDAVLWNANEGQEEILCWRTSLITLCFILFLVHGTENQQQFSPSAQDCCSEREKIKKLCSRQERSQIIPLCAVTTSSTCLLCLCLCNISVTLCFFALLEFAPL